MEGSDEPFRPEEFFDNLFIPGEISMSEEDIAW